PLPKYIANHWSPGSECPAVAPVRPETARDGLPRAPDGVEFRRRDFAIRKFPATFPTGNTDPASNGLPDIKDLRCRRSRRPGPRRIQAVRASRPGNVLFDCANAPG